MGVELDTCFVLTLRHFQIWLRYAVFAFVKVEVVFNFSPFFIRIKDK